MRQEDTIARSLASCLRVCRRRRLGASRWPRMRCLPGGPGRSLALLMTQATSSSVPTLDLVRHARERIGPFIRRTPVLTSRSLDSRAGAQLFFKCENFQRAGVFKARGAFNAVLSLGEAEARRGVVTSSSGNQAAALSLAARSRGIPAYLAMPK